MAQADEVFDFCKEHRGSGVAVTLGATSVTFSKSLRYPGEGCLVRNEATGVEHHCTRFSILKNQDKNMVFDCEDPSGHRLVRGNLELFTLMDQACFDVRIFDSDAVTLLGCRKGPTEFHYFGLNGSLALPTTCLELKGMPNGSLVCFRAEQGNSEIPMYKVNGTRVGGGESDDLCRLVPEPTTHLMSEVAELHISSKTYLFWKQKRPDGAAGSLCFGKGLHGANPNAPQENRTGCSQIRIDISTAHCYEETGSELVQTDSTLIDERHLMEVRFF